MTPLPLARPAALMTGSPGRGAVQAGRELGALGNDDGLRLFGVEGARLGDEVEIPGAPPG